jgi:hypothetical protein
MISVLDLGLGSRSLSPIGHCSCSDFFHPAGTCLDHQQKSGRVNTREIWITGPIVFVLSFRNAFFTDQQQSQCVELHHGYLDGVRCLDTVIGAVTRCVFVPGKQPAAPPGSTKKPDLPSNSSELFTDSIMLPNPCKMQTV